MTNARWQQMDIRLYAVVASLLVSVYTILLPELPNDDAYLYIKTAEIYLEQGLAAALQHYSWVGYSVIIAEFSRLGFSLLTSAYVINSLFFLLLVYSFVSIVRLIDDSKPVVVLAALTVLLYPELNEFRYFIIRDVGFWALSLFALLQFILYSQQQRWQNAAAFCVALILGVVFRVEALLYLVLTPLSFVFIGDKAQRYQLFKQLAAMVVASLVVVSLVLFAFGLNLGALMLDFISVYQPFIANFLSPDSADTAELGRLLFGDHAAAFSQQYMTAFIAAGLLVILGMTVFYGISGAYFWLLAYGAAKKYLRLGREVATPIVSYAVINGIILFVFLYITRYLSSRYAMVLCMMLVLQVPIVVNSILANSRGTSRERLTSIFLALFFSYCAFDSYISLGKPKDFLVNSADYVAEQAGSNTGLITNNRTVAYYSGMVDNYDQVLRVPTEYEILNAAPGDLIALEMIYDMTLLVEDESISPYLQFDRAFPNNDDRQVSVYRRVNP